MLSIGHGQLSRRCLVLTTGPDDAIDRTQGELGGAGIDVLEVEQMDDFVRGLADTPNLHLSPHAAWYSTEAAVRCTLSPSVGTLSGVSDHSFSSPFGAFCRVSEASADVSWLLHTRRS